MTNIRRRIVVYLKIIDFKTPYYMKLPKDHQFFKHHMQNLKLNRMKDAAKNKMLDNKDLFQGAMEKLQVEQEKAKIFNVSPKRGKIIAYE